MFSKITSSLEICCNKPVLVIFTSHISNIGWSHFNSYLAITDANGALQVKSNVSPSKTTWSRVGLTIKVLEGNALPQADRSMNILSFLTILLAMFSGKAHFGLPTSLTLVFLAQSPTHRSSQSQMRGFSVMSLEKEIYKVHIVTRISSSSSILQSIISVQTELWKVL